MCYQRLVALPSFSILPHIINMCWCTHFMYTVQNVHSNWNFCDCEVLVLVLFHIGLWGIGTCAFSHWFQSQDLKHTLYLTATEMYFTWRGTDVQHVVKSNTISIGIISDLRAWVCSFTTHMCWIHFQLKLFYCVLCSQHSSGLLMKLRNGKLVMKCTNYTIQAHVVDRFFLAQCISVYISPQASVRFCLLVFDSTHPPASPICLLFWHTHWFGGLMIKNFVQQKAQWCIYSYDVSLFVWDFVDQPLIPECMEDCGWLTKESNCCLRQELETSAWWGLHCMDHKTWVSACVGCYMCILQHLYIYVYIYILMWSDLK